MADTADLVGFIRSIEDSASRWAPRLRLPARVAWIAIAVFLFSFFAYVFPQTFALLAHTECTARNASNCPTGQLTPVYVDLLGRLHIPASAAEELAAVLTLGVSLLYWGIGLLVFWRRGDQLIGYLTSLLCIELGGTAVFAVATPRGMPLPFQAAAGLIELSLAPILILFLFMFPTGRFVPRWSIAFCVVTLVGVVVPINALPLIVQGLFVAVIYLGPAAIQIYRYARVYNGEARQQTKIFVFGLSIALSLLMASSIVSAVGPRSLLNQVFGGPMWLLIWTILLLSVAIPILRYRLWDIDVLINRTLVYVSLTATLVALYVGLILLLQGLVRLLTGGLAQQPLIIAISTLTIAALFQPARQAIQRTIDRRFYRRKYDAIRTLTTFQSRLRDTIDLDRLQNEMVKVVDETMQPQFAMFWLPAPDVEHP